MKEKYFRTVLECTCWTYFVQYFQTRRNARNVADFNLIKILLLYFFFLAVLTIDETSVCFENNICTKRYSPTKTEVGQKWYQSLAFSLQYCLAADIFHFYLKGHYFFKSIKPVSAFNYKKLAL